MKSIACLLFSWVMALGICAQGVFNNQTNTTLQRVIEDYPNKFREIRGQKLEGLPHAASYQSKVQIPGSSNVMIVQENGSNDAHYTWQCDLFSSASFEATRERFKEYFSNIKNTIVKVEGQQPFILNGKFQNPEDHRNTYIFFQLLPASGAMRFLKVELAMLKEGSQWQITLKVFSEGDAGLASQELAN